MIIGNYFNTDFPLFAGTYGTGRIDFNHLSQFVPNVESNPKNQFYYEQDIAMTAKLIKINPVLPLKPGNFTAPLNIIITYH